jgi:signal transduction histidine kinase
MIEPARAILFDGFLERAMITIGLAGVLVIAGLLLAVRQTSRPVALLAANARTFAARLDAPDLAEAGAPALRDLSAAFNQMKAQIRGLVEERTRSLAAIAHDLRTYLTRLRLRAEFISDPDQRVRAERDIAEMGALIDDALLFASTASGRKAHGLAVCDLAELTGAEVAIRQELGQPVTFVPQDMAVLARIEPLAFKRVLANLVDNAIRYGGAARVALSTQGAEAVLRVEDDGPGVPEAELDRMTAPFERLDVSRGREGGGAGLGLAIVRALAEANGGTFILRNRAQGGLVAEARLRGA